MLTDVHTINQRQFKNLAKFSIAAGTNLLILGPSGGGKTVIAKEAAQEAGVKMIYINLSVLERTDFQGFPVISEDRSLVSYATPDFLPFADTALRDEKKSLTALLSTLEDNASNKDVIAYLQLSLAKIKEKEAAKALYQASPYLDKDKVPQLAMKRIAELAVQAKSLLGEKESYMFLFDEVDKAATETTQTLLETLQFGSINGRDLDIRSCILTGNLPDEHAHSNQISHAISKRCATFKLNLEFNMWRDWAFNNNVNDEIIQFLSSEPGLLYKTAPDGDPTAYALPSPRTWTEAAKALDALDIFRLDSKTDIDEFRNDIISGFVGDVAAVKYKNWYQYYRKFDPVISELVSKGTHPPGWKDLPSHELLILAIASASKVYSEIKSNNKSKLAKTTKNVFDWLDSGVHEEVQMAAVRISFGGDFDNIHKYNLVQIPEFKNVFMKINKKFVDNNIK